jgi:hypothetical protein
VGCAQAPNEGPVVPLVKEEPGLLTHNYIHLPSKQSSQHTMAYMVSIQVHTSEGCQAVVERHGNLHETIDEQLVAPSSSACYIGSCLPHYLEAHTILCKHSGLPRHRRLPSKHTASLLLLLPLLLPRPLPLLLLLPLSPLLLPCWSLLLLLLVIILIFKPVAPLACLVLEVHSTQLATVPPQQPLRNGLH